MLKQWNEWSGSTAIALLTVVMSTALIAQGQERVGARDSEFGNVDRILEEGIDPARLIDHPRSPTTPRIDLERVNKQTLMNLLEESVMESERLYRSLQNDYRRNPQIRPLLSELLTMRARASRLGEDVEAKIALNRLLPQLQQLDSDWRLLSHQMSQVFGLSNASKDSVQRIDGLQRQLEKLFRMDPQLDRRALLQEFSGLNSSLRNLIQELETDPAGGNRLYELILDARKLDQQVYRIQNMVYDRYPYAQLVTEYNRFLRTWTPLSAQLQQLNNRYVERSIRSVMLANTNLHNLLWLEHETNRDNLRQIATALMRDVDEFFNRVPLKLLMHFQDTDSVLQTANDFYGTVQNFQDCVKRNEDPASMVECYQYVEEYGNDFVRAFEPLRSQAGRVVLREIEDGVLALRNELNLAGTVTSVDTRAMLDTAARLENLADHLDFDVRQWLNQERPNYRNDALQASRRFLTRTEKIHRMLSSHPTANELKRETSDLAEEFRGIYQYLGRCRTEHRNHLRVLSQDISQAIYELRAPLQL